MFQAPPDARLPGGLIDQQQVGLGHANVDCLILPMTSIAGAKL
jgi:hypothetical protein